ncbi:MAG: hypothetical protein U0822_23040 [Anaerolineae bacterium]
MEGSYGVARRSLLRRGLLLLGALAGGRALIGSVAEAAHAPPPVPSNAATFTLGGRHLMLRSAEGQAAWPRVGDRLGVSGELVGSDGVKRGEFYAAAVCMHTPFGDSPFGATTLDMQTFNLADGSLVGMGTGQLVDETAAVYAIVGGTGQYLGARGSYVARQKPYGLGGDGTAEFTFTLLA